MASVLARAAGVLAALAVATAQVTYKALPTYVSIFPTNNMAIAFRHCDYVASACPYEESNDDFRFKPVPALNGNANGVSFQSTNYPDQYVTVVGGSGLQTTRLGIKASPDVNDASYVLMPTGGQPNVYTITTLSTTYKRQMFTLADSNSGPCSYNAPSGDMYLAPAGQGVTQTFLVGVPPPPPPPPAATVIVNATGVDHPMQRWFMGCHSDPGYAQEPRGWYAQLVYGESFEKGTTSVFAWNDITTPGLNAVVQLDPAVNVNPNKAVPSLAISYSTGSGVAGWANRGIGNEGMSIQGGKPYEGYVLILAPTGASLFLGVNDYTAGHMLDSTTIAVPASSSWQKVDFSLNPTAGTNCTGIAPGSNPNIDCGGMGANAGHICVQCGGELQVGINQPGSVHIGYVYFAPGPWGRVGDLPVLKSAADTMNAMGVTIIRQGGTVSQSFRWKDWRGVPWQRGSMQHVWGNSLVSGWGLFEFIDMCAALGIEPVVTLAYDLNNATDWADLIEYCYGDATTTWGNMRINVDGHPDPYPVHTFELGNEQYNPDFVDQVAAIEARRATVGAPPIFYMFPTNQGLSAADQQRYSQLGLPVASTGPDCHVGGGGGVECAQAVWNADPSFAQGAINCETNDSISTFERAMHEAVDLQDFFNLGNPDLPRMRARTASFCAERSGHFDAFDQGISFFLPNMTWLQPPGYVHAMINQTWQPNGLGVSITGGGNGYPAISAQLSDDGKSATVQVVNPVASANATQLTIAFLGFVPSTSVTSWTLTSPGGDMQGANTPANPTYISPQQSTIPWPAGMNQATVTIQPASFTIFQFTAA